MGLNPEVVKEVFFNSLLGGSAWSDFIQVKGEFCSFNFSRIKLEKNKEEIVSLLNELPVGFKKGMLFIDAFMNKYGKQWTGNKEVVDCLLALGIAIGAVEIHFVSEVFFPGGLKSYIVK
ncbi:MAG TPA: hypothetical protein VJY47_00985 [Candidatus Dojkabacteria bacterium]|nr:hypothetical protein [Candidatus Dojkabacteria bacterium]